MFTKSTEAENRDPEHLLVIVLFNLAKILSCRERYLKTFWERRWFSAISWSPETRKKLKSGESVHLSDALRTARRAMLVVAVYVMA